MTRRDFITGTAGLVVAAGPVAARAQTSAPTIKTVRTSVLEIGYHETGDASRFPVILLHGFPDDAHACDEVAPALAKAGYHRHFKAPGESRFADTERQLARRPPIAAPTIVLHGADDAFGRPSAEMTAAERSVLPRIVDKRIVEGAGHFVPHEKPGAVSAALIDVLNATRSSG